MNTLNEEVRKGFHPTAQSICFNKKADTKKKWPKAVNGFDPPIADLLGMAVGLNKISGQFVHRGHIGVVPCGYKQDCRAGLGFACYNHMSTVNNPVDI